MAIINNYNFCDKHTDRRTWRFDDRPGPEGRVGKNYTRRPGCARHIRLKKMSTAAIFRISPVISRTKTVILRTNLVIFRTNALTFKTTGIWTETDKTDKNRKKRAKRDGKGQKQRNRNGPKRTETLKTDRKEQKRTEVDMIYRAKFGQV